MRQGDSLYELNPQALFGENTFKTGTLDPGLDVVDKKIIPVASAPLSSKQSFPEREKEQGEREDGEPGNAHQSCFSDHVVFSVCSDAVLTKNYDT